MSLIAGVYHRFTDEPPFNTHPTVVILEIDGTKECLVIPAFTKGHHFITANVTIAQQEGLSSDAVAIEMNNQDSINWHRKFDANPEVLWSIAQVARLEQSLFKQHSRIGTMKTEYLLQIYKGVQLFMESKRGENQFSDSVKKKIRQAIRKIESDSF